MHYYELIKFIGNISDIHYHYCKETELDEYIKKFEPTIIHLISKKEYEKTIQIN